VAEESPNQYKTKLMTTALSTYPMIFADAHVHLHECFSLEQLLNAALQNFQKNATREGCEQPFQGVLFLAEIGTQNRFSKLLEKISDNSPKEYPLEHWTIYPTHEMYSLLAKHSSGQSIFLFAGRQVVTLEKLEVLALMTEQPFEDGLLLRTTLEKIIETGGVPVLPWGVGKWIGKRGKLLKELLAQNQFPILFLGDNSGRPMFWSRPVYFKQAEASGIQVLPGTDPLPLASEHWRPGSFGFTTKGMLSTAQPGQEMRSILLNSANCLKAYGLLESPTRFIRNQLAIRL
jgi:hypothetical protein